jgi:hypothetical protein
MDGNLIEKKIVDHHILYKNINVNNVNINIYSINIAQKSDLRTMVMFNKIQCYLKGGSRSIVDYSFFDDLPDLLMKFNYHLHEVIEGEKIEIHDEKFLKQVKNLIKRNFDKVYLRKYVPKGQFKTDGIFRKRFEKTNFNYIDIIFEEETIEHYRYRIQSVLKHLKQLSLGRKHVIFCFQEIKPVRIFLEEAKKENPSWILIDPIELDTKQEGKSNNVLFVQEFPYSINRMTTTKHDIILKLFNHEVLCDGEWISQRNPNQNVKYYIPSLKCFFYNIHSFLNEEKTIFTKINKIIKYVFDRKSNFIIIGDLNFKLPYKIVSQVQEILHFHKIFCKFTPSITNRKIKTFDGLLIKL